jgi:uncharacterized membrane protein YeaQ/YmgE (transglycosylase-associated protein family)
MYLAARPRVKARIFPRRGPAGAHDGPQPQENGIDIPFTLYIWLAVGAAMGWLFSFLPGPAGPGAAIESIAVGAFGACLGGEFVAVLLRGAAARHPGFTLGGLALAIGSSIVLLVLLRLMRGAVGPMKPHKRRGRR